MDWRLQGASIVASAVLCITPLVVGPQVFSGPGGTPLSDDAFSAAWNSTASVMTYPLIAGLALAILGVVWQGPIRQMYAWILAATSFCLGGFNLLSLIMVSFTTLNHPEGGSGTIPAQYLLAIGLLVPALILFSNLIWLSRVGRRNPRPVIWKQVGPTFRVPEEQSVSLGNPSGE